MGFGCWKQPDFGGWKHMWIPFAKLELGTNEKKRNLD